MSGLENPEGSTAQPAASALFGTALTASPVLARFSDERSRKQIAAFRVREMHAARWRNALNLERWNDACRDRWELAQLGSVRRVTRS